MRTSSDDLGNFTGAARLRTKTANASPPVGHGKFLPVLDGAVGFALHAVAVHVHVYRSVGGPRMFRTLRLVFFNLCRFHPSRGGSEARIGQICNVGKRCMIGKRALQASWANL